MNILFIGDIVGKPGRRIVREKLPQIIEEKKVDLVIANGENTAGGKGITLEKMDELQRYGVHVFTLGNHLWADKKTPEAVEKDPNIPIVRPANLPPGNPGKGYHLHTFANGKQFAIVSLIGQAFMKHHFDCPFRCIDNLLTNELKSDKIVGIMVDIHAETTAEKITLKHYLDGRVSALFGTHTHVPTADLEISEAGTAFMCDVGMSGPYDSVIGMDKEKVLQKFLRQASIPFVVADGPAVLNAVYFEVENKKTTHAEHISIKED